jgi:hypothetical protein
MMTFPIYGKIKNVPNHQPVVVPSRKTILAVQMIHGFHGYAEASFPCACATVQLICRFGKR